MDQVSQMIPDQFKDQVRDFLGPRRLAATEDIADVNLEDLHRHGHTFGGHHSMHHNSQHHDSSNKDDKKPHTDEKKVNHKSHDPYKDWLKKLPTMSKDQAKLEAKHFWQVIFFVCAIIGGFIFAVW